MIALDALRQALADGADDAARDAALADAQRDGGAIALAEGLRLCLDAAADRGVPVEELLPVRIRLAAALEDAAREDPVATSTPYALQAAALCRDVLNDGESATRALVLALRIGADDDDQLARAVEAAGGADNACHLLERALKRPDARTDNYLTARVRRSLARVKEKSGDVDGAFFEAMKAARKSLDEPLLVDEVYRLGLEVKRFDEAAAFYRGLGEDGSLTDRLRATAFNKLGTLLEQHKRDLLGALAAFRTSLGLHETKAARRAVERIEAASELSENAPAEAAPVDAVEGDTARQATAPNDTTTSAVVPLPAFPPDPPPPPALARPDEVTDVHGIEPVPPEPLSELDLAALAPPLSAEPAVPAVPALLDDDTLPPGVVLLPPAGHVPSDPGADAAVEAAVGKPADVVVEPVVESRWEPLVEPLVEPLLAVEARAAGGGDPSGEIADEDVDAAFAQKFGAVAPPALSPFDAAAADAVDADVVDAGELEVVEVSDRLPAPRPISVEGEPEPSWPPPPPDEDAADLDDAADSFFSSGEDVALQSDEGQTDGVDRAAASGPAQRGSDDVVATADATAMDAAPPVSEAFEPGTSGALRLQTLALLRATASDDGIISVTEGSVEEDSGRRDAPLPGPSPLHDGGALPEVTVRHTVPMTDGVAERWVPEPWPVAPSEPPAVPVVDAGAAVEPTNAPAAAPTPAQSAQAPVTVVEQGPPAALILEGLSTASGDVPRPPPSDAPDAAADDDGARPTRAEPERPTKKTKKKRRSSKSDESAISAADRSAEAGDSASKKRRPLTALPERSRKSRARNDDVDGPVEATVRQATPTFEVPRTDSGIEPQDLRARAQRLLEGDDPEQCVACALTLQAEIPGDPRVLRLAAHALLLEAPGGSLSPEAVDLFVAEAPRHGDRAASMALDIQRALPPATHAAYLHVWLAGARAAGFDADKVLALLQPFADQDAPDGPAFAFVEDSLAAQNDVERRDALYARAARLVDNQAHRAVLVKRRIALLEGEKRHTDALPLHAQLALELTPDDATARQAARHAHASRASPEERARFLARLAKRAPGDEALAVLRELLDVRMAVDDRIGAEAAARELMHKRPGDAQATQVLLRLVEEDPRREAELVELLQKRAQNARAQDDDVGALSTLERLAVVLENQGRRDEAADVWADAVRLAPLHGANLDRCLALLAEQLRHKDAVALLTELADVVPDAGRTVSLLLQAAEIARTRMQKRGRARELIDRAVELSPKNVDALDARATILVEVGDAAQALSTLERLAGLVTDGAARARAHLRIGNLLEEQLLRADDALKRYRAAVEADPRLEPAWQALRTLARQRGDRALLAFSLEGLAALENDVRERASLLKQLGRLERDERVDLTAAERAFSRALSADPSDVEALQSLVALACARVQGEPDVEVALASPSPVLLEALRPYLLRTADVVALPRSLRRLEAITLSQAGERARAQQRFEALLDDDGADLPVLLAFAAHLAQAPRGEAGAAGRRLKVLESVLLHHAFSLPPDKQVEVWGDVCALRGVEGDDAGARKAAKKAMTLASSDELRRALSLWAVQGIVRALEGAPDNDAEPAKLVAALHVLSERATAPAEQSQALARAANVTLHHLHDRPAARRLLAQAVDLDPESTRLRDTLLDMDVADGNAGAVIAASKEMLAKEQSAERKAQIHLRLFKLYKKLGVDLESAAKDLKAALALDPGNGEVIDAAERFFGDRKDAEGLDRLYAAQLKQLPRDDTKGRLALLERLAQLRRYDRRDLVGAVEALEAMCALDTAAIKPREDAARLYTELGRWREAVQMWRSVLDRDALAGEAWRALFSLFARTRQGDEAFAVGASMLALEIADDELARAVRALRPPFPRWPVPVPGASKDPVRKKLAHPLERTPIRAVLDAAGPRLLPLFARPLKDFGLRRKDALSDRDVPASVLLAVRTLAALLGLPEAPPLYRAQLGATDGATPPFAVLPTTEPAVVVTDEVLSGGMTPERAFALGRAGAWLPAHGLLAAAAEPQQLKLVLEALTWIFLGEASVEQKTREVEGLATELRPTLLQGLGPDGEAALRGDIVPALRDYVHARSQLDVRDLRAGVGYTGDRTGFLLCSDLTAAVRVIKASAGQGQAVGARLAIKELVLFSVSAPYLGLRRELSLALPDAATGALLDLV